RLANGLSRLRLFKLAGGIAPGGRVPKFAPVPFRAWFEARPAVNEGRERVILWADTFNNFFHPEVCRAAVEVLEEAGFHVQVQAEKLCCGRPLYDYGMLDLAKRKLRQILEDLRPPIEQGTPVIGLEPSCVSVFRDEMRGLFPNHADAERLAKQTFLLSEFLVKRGWRPRADRDGRAGAAAPRPGAADGGPRAARRAARVADRNPAPARAARAAGGCRPCSRSRGGGGPVEGLTREFWRMLPAMLPGRAT